MNDAVGHLIAALNADDASDLPCDLQRAMRDFICQVKGQSSTECGEATEIVENNCGPDPS